MHRDREQLHAFTEQHRRVVPQQRHHRFDAERRVTQHEVGPGPVDSFQIPLVRDSADDSEPRVQAPAVHRQINVHRIFVGGQQDGTGLENPGALQHTPIGRVSREHALYVRGQRRQDFLGSIDDVYAQALPSECLYRSLSDLARADDEHRCRDIVQLGQQAVQRADLWGCAGDDEHAVRLYRGIGVRGPQLATLPEAHDAQTGRLPQPGIAYRGARKRRVAHGQLRDLQSFELADNVGLQPPGIHAVGEVIPELMLERQHRRGSAQLEDVHRVLFLDERRDGHSRRDLPDGQRDVRVGGVLAVGKYQPGPGHQSALVCRAVVVLSREHEYAVAEQLPGADRVGLDDEVRDSLIRQSLHQARCDGVVLGNYDVVLRTLRHFPGRPQANARLEPWRVEKPDEQEGQHHQQEHDAGQQHDDAEDPAYIACKRDVAEPERGHDDERPVQAGDPRVLLVL